MSIETPTFPATPEEHTAEAKELSPAERKIEESLARLKALAEKYPELLTEAMDLQNDFLALQKENKENIEVALKNQVAKFLEPVPGLRMDEERGDLHF